MIKYYRQGPHTSSRGRKKSWCGPYFTHPCSR